MAQSYSNYLGSGDRSTQIMMTSTFLNDAAYNSGRLLNTSVTGSSVGGTWFMNTGESVAGRYLRFDLLSAARIIDKVTIYASSGGGSADDVYQWQGFNGSWHNIGSPFNMSTVDSAGTEFDLANSTPYTSYRMMGVSGTSGNPNLNFEFSIDDSVSAGFLHKNVSDKASLGNGTTWTTSAITTTVDSWLVAIFFGEHPGASFGISSVTDSDGLTWTKRDQLQNHTTNAYCDNEIWYARRTTPSSGTVTFNFSGPVDDAAYTVLAITNLPDMSSLWKPGVEISSYHNDTGTSATPVIHITHTGAGLALISGGSPRNNQPDHDLGYAEGMAISSTQNNGGSQWCYTNVSAVVTNFPDDYAVQWRGQVHDYSVLAAVVDIGDGSIPGDDAFDESGTFEVQPYGLLTVETWGGGGAGIAIGVNDGEGFETQIQGSPGGDTTIADLGITAGGGAPGNASTNLGGVGGTPSGGNVANTNGNTGGNGGTIQPGVGIGAGAPHGGGNALPGTANPSPGTHGTAPGGGGSGVFKGTSKYPGGGSGAYVKSVFVFGESGSPSVGDLIAYTVGAGGVPGMYGTAINDGGPGANGRVKFTWTAGDDSPSSGDFESDGSSSSSDAGSSSGESGSGGSGDSGSDVGSSDMASSDVASSDSASEGDAPSSGDFISDESHSADDPVLLLPVNVVGFSTVY